MKNWHDIGECGSVCADCQLHPEWVCGQDCSGCCNEAEGAGRPPERSVIAPDYLCTTCHAHWDHHDRECLCCPAYTAADGSVVFSHAHHYTGLYPERAT